MNYFNKKSELAIFFIINLFLIIFFSLPVKAQDEVGCCGQQLEGGFGIKWRTLTQANCTLVGNSGGKEGGKYTPDFFPNKIASDNGASCIDKPNNTTISEPSKIIPPILHVSIPGFGNFSDVKCDDPDVPCKIPWLGEYIQAIYKYSLTIVGILAVIIMMIGGVLWVTAGGSKEQIGTAKSFIRNGILGVIIMVCSYTLLTILNPNLTILRPLNIQYIKYNSFKDVLTDDEYKANTATHYPSKGEDIIIGPQQSKNTFFLNKYAKNIYSMLSTKIALAGNIFDAPTDIQHLLQCGDDLRNKNYAAQGKTNCVCTEDVKKDNEECGGTYSTICTSGCGVVSLNMVLNAYHVIGSNPNDTMAIAKYMENRPGIFRKCNSGTSEDGLIDYADSLGMVAELLSPSTDQKWVDSLLEAGYPLLAGLSPASGCTGQGHWVVLYYKEGKNYLVVNPETSHDGTNGKLDCRKKLPNGTTGINKYIFVHPLGNPDISTSTCVEKWNYGCYYSSNNCCGGNCIFDDGTCKNINSTNLNNKACYKCGDCIATDHWGCKQNSDCCSGRCHTSEAEGNRYECY
jgi:hypothetical protein